MHFFFVSPTFAIPTSAVELLTLCPMSFRDHSFELGRAQSKSEFKSTRSPHKHAHTHSTKENNNNGTNSESNTITGGTQTDKKKNTRKCSYQCYQCRYEPHCHAREIHHEARIDWILCQQNFVLQLVKASEGGGCMNVRGKGFFVLLHSLAPCISTTV